MSPAAPTLAELNGGVEVLDRLLHVVLAWGVAGVLGPVIVSRVYAATGSYQYAFFGSAILAAAALVNLTIVRAPDAVPVPGAPARVRA